MSNENTISKIDQLQAILESLEPGELPNDARFSLLIILLSHQNSREGIASMVSSLLAIAPAFLADKNVEFTHKEALRHFLTIVDRSRFNLDQKETGEKLEQLRTMFTSEQHTIQ